MRSAPACGCCRSVSHSSSVGLPGLFRSFAGTSSLPTSCTSAAQRSRSRSACGSAISSAIRSVRTRTRLLCPRVSGSCRAKDATSARIVIAALPDSRSGTPEASNSRCLIDPASRATFHRVGISPGNSNDISNKAASGRRRRSSRRAGHARKLQATTMADQPGDPLEVRRRSGHEPGDRERRADGHGDGCEQHDEADRNGGCSPLPPPRGFTICESRQPATPDVSGRCLHRTARVGSLGPKGCYLAHSPDWRVLGGRRTVGTVTQGEPSLQQVRPPIEGTPHPPYVINRWAEDVSRNEMDVSLNEMARLRSGRGNFASPLVDPRLGLVGSGGDVLLRLRTSHARARDPADLRHFVGSRRSCRRIARPRRPVHAVCMGLRR